MGEFAGVRTSADPMKTFVAFVYRLASTVRFMPNLRLADRRRFCGFMRLSTKAHLMVIHLEMGAGSTPFFSSYGNARLRSRVGLSRECSGYSTRSNLNSGAIVVSPGELDLDGRVGAGCATIRRAPRTSNTPWSDFPRRAGPNRHNSEAPRSTSSAGRASGPRFLFAGRSDPKNGCAP